MKHEARLVDNGAGGRVNGLGDVAHADEGQPIECQERAEGALSVHKLPAPAQNLHLPCQQAHRFPLQRQPCSEQGRITTQYLDHNTAENADKLSKAQPTER